MKKYITKVILFLSPIIFLQGFTMLFYSTDKGDLLRLGYIMDIFNYSYRNIFKDEIHRNIYFYKISDTNLNTQNKYTVLTVGDSFSEQNGNGYQNYLAENDSIKVIHFDKFLHDNPIQSLYGILNGDLLDNLKVDYIILQSVERYFVNSAKEINRDKIVHKESLIKDIKDHKVYLNDEHIIDKLFSDRIFKFPLYNVLYLFDDNAYDSQTYRVKTIQNLFSIDKNELLFYFKDLKNLETNNNLEFVFKLNQELNILSNKLKEKDIKLIVLPSPDKFDFYYDYIVDNKKYTKPLFFDHLEKMPKDYLYVNSKQILREEMKNKKDIYFYDDTHWSPWAAKVIANELAKIITRM
ncbi:MAG: hypothetical protein WAV86_00730 [Lutibacter sp.]